MDDKILLSIPQFCARYGISRSFAYKQLRAGELKGRKAGKLTKIAVPDAEEWARKLPGYKVKAA